MAEGYTIRGAQQCNGRYERVVMLVEYGGHSGEMQGCSGLPGDGWTPIYKLVGESDCVLWKQDTGWTVSEQLANLNSDPEDL